MWKELADVLGRQLTIIGRSEDDKPGHVELKYRLGQVKEQHLTMSRARSTRTATSSTSTSATRRAREALEIHLRAGRQAEAERRRHPRAGLRAAQEWAPLVGVHEIQLAAEKDSLRRTSLLLRIGELQRTKLLDAEKAFDAYARCVQGRSVDRSRQGTARGPRCAARGRLGSAGPAVRGRAREARPRRQARARARDEGRAQLRGPAQR